MGALVTPKAFAIVVLGGMGSVPGAPVGVHLLAMAESLGGYLCIGHLPGSRGLRRARVGVHLQAEWALPGDGVTAARASAAVPLVLLGAATLLPLVLSNEYYLQILTQGYILAISACGLNVILGLAGQLSLAHAGFFGIGAYTLALLGTKASVPFWAGLPAGSR
jgi:ABC-type branched-subunit amino acid transport system permease subunit